MSLELLAVIVSIMLLMTFTLRSDGWISIRGKTVNIHAILIIILTVINLLLLVDSRK